MACHHKIDSATSNVSRTTNQLHSTGQISKIKTITTVQIIKRDRLQPLRVMINRITNKDILIINQLLIININ